MNPAQSDPLSRDQIECFRRDGVLVVENILSTKELATARQGLCDTLRRHGVHPEDLAHTGQHLQSLSSTGGSGGVLDLFYDEWKLQVALHPKLFAATRQLWRAIYYQESEKSDIPTWQKHPYGPFDTSRGYAYMDRIGYRLPTALARELGELHHPHKKKKQRPIQRSLTPHLDCCPHSLFQNVDKWRPIQSFVSLTDNLKAHTGGFEAARSFHTEFHEWIAQRPPCASGQPAPCLGEYTHIRPQEDVDIMQRVQHVPVPAGSAVFGIFAFPTPMRIGMRGTNPGPSCTRVSCRMSN